MLQKGVWRCHWGAFGEYFGLAWEPLGINLGRLVVLMGSLGLDFDDFVAVCKFGAFGKFFCITLGACVLIMGSIC